MRLQLARTGALEITLGPAIASPDVLRFALATERLDPGDPFLQHKTTRRDLYERLFQAALAKGLDEVVFLNRRGEVAEASRHSVFVEVRGQLVTPPLSCGVLPGVLRQQLIADGRATEQSVSIELLKSNPVMLGNSLHGLRAAQLTGRLVH